MTDKAKCLICKEEIESRPENRYFPFCSKRCKQRDLGMWFSEQYAIPVSRDSTERSVEGAVDPDAPARRDKE